MNTMDAAKEGAGSPPALLFGKLSAPTRRWSSGDTAWSGMSIETHITPAQGRYVDCKTVAPSADYSLVLINAGAVQVETRVAGVQRAYCVQRGYLALSNSQHELQRLSWKGSAEYTAVGITSKLVDRLCQAERRSLSVELPEYSDSQGDFEVTALVHCMRRDIEAGCPGGLIYAESLSLALIAHLTRRYGHRNTARACTSARLTSAQRRLVETYIEEHLGDDISLSSLASVIGISPSHFAQCFRETFGAPPHRFVLQTRIALARDYLLRDEDSVAQIAFNLGFADQSHFTQAFKRIVGTTPARYRRQH